MLGDGEEVPVDGLINNNLVVDHDHGCKQFVFGIAIVLIWGDVGQPNVGLVFDFDIENIVLIFVGYSQFEPHVSTNHDDWPQPILVYFLPFHRGAVLTKLDFCKLSQLVVGDDQVHEFSLYDERELHPRFFAAHVSLDFRPCNLERRAFSLWRLIKILDRQTFNFEGVVAQSVRISGEA